jgi:hypothetical protein
MRQLLVRVTTPLGEAEGRRVWTGNTARRATDDQAVWLLRAGLSCPLADTALGAPTGAVVAALPDGGALRAGGLATGTLATSESLLLVEGLEFGVVLERGMLLRRAYASASPVNDVVMVAGGTADLRAGAHDTYELFDVATGRFDAARSGRLQAPRMRHAASRLADDRVLLIGGAAEDQGEALATCELIDLASGSTETLEPCLRSARVEPSALMLDSGRVLVLGGRDASGRLLGSAELFEQDAQRFVQAEIALPLRAEVSVAAMPGARAAWLTCDLTGCELVLISEVGGTLQVAPVELDFASQLPNGMKALQLLYVGAGQLLWTGADDSDPSGRRRAFVIDPVEAALRRVDASRVPSQLVRLGNDLIAELDEAGASLRAAFTRGRYASPAGDLLANASEHLVLDAPGHWLRRADSLEALVEAARVDLGELRLAAFRGELHVEGDFRLLVYDGLGQSAELRVREGMLEAGDCRSPLQAPGRLTVLRSGTQLTLTGTPCVMESSAQPLGIALWLGESSALRGIAIERM